VFRKERTILVQRSVPCDVSDLRQESCRDLIPVLQKQLWAIEAHGNRTRLLNRGLTVNAFAWSPQDDRLALVGENGELNLLDIETAAVTPLVTPQAEATNPGNVERIVWSLDGTRIAYEWNQTNSSSAGLWLVTLYPLQRKQVYVSNAARRGDAILGGWMPDNQSIFFWQSDTRTAPLNDGVPLYTLRLDSTPFSPQRLSDALLVHADFIAPAPTRSNAGARNLIALTAGSGQSTWLNKRIEILKPLTPPNLSAMTPQWSPDGAHIAFVAMPQRSELSADDEVLQGLLQRRIWIADAFGEREPQRVTNNASYRDERPFWSADGKHILFARFDRQGRVSLWLVTLSTNFTRQIVDELTPAPDPFGFYGHIEWDALFDWWRGVE
jgi:Tol biopolymer transport system component